MAAIIAGAIIANKLEGMPDLLSASLDQLPVGVREHEVIQKSTPSTRVGVIEKASVRKIEFNLFSGVAINLGKSVVGLSMMPWSFGKARRELVAAGWNGARYGTA